MDETELRRAAQEVIRRHMVNLVLNLDVETLFLVYLYSYPDGEILDRSRMLDFASDRYTSRAKLKFDLLMHLSRKGHEGVKALVHAMVFTGQKYLADQVHPEMSEEFWARRNQHYPRFPSTT